MFMDKKTMPISIKIPESYFVDEKLILKFIWRGKHSRIPNSIFKNKVRGLTLPNVKTYYDDTVNKTVWYWRNYR